MRGLTEGLFVEPVELDVVRQDEVRTVADQQVLRVDTAAGELVQLLNQLDGIHHHAGADDTRGVGVEHARRHQMEVELGTADDDGVTGVTPAVGPDHELGRLGQEVH